MRRLLPAKIVFALTIVLLLVAAACGSQGGAPPIAEAGPDQATTVGATVTLDGSGSRDPDGDPLGFMWDLTAVPAGSAATLSGADTVSPSVVPDVAGEYEATLVVTAGGARSSDTVTVTAAAAGSVLADAGPDRTVPIGTPVTLDGSASTGDSLTFSWQVATRPAGSSATLQGAATASSSFTPDVGGEYVVTLEVSDGTTSDTDSVTVTASDDPPTISSIEEQRVAQAESLEVPFTIQDELPGSVTFTVASSDTTLVPTSGLEVFGSGAERTLRVTPNPAGLGAVEIALTATDAGGGVASEVFVVRVELPFQTQFPKLTASDAAAEDRFGISVAIDGEYAIVGASLDDDNGSGSGSAYVFRRSGDTWSEVDKLTASDAAAGHLFGASVAIDGEYAIVGAPFDDDNGVVSGSAYIYRRGGDVWSEIDKLTASDGATGDQFGNAVAISGEYAIVGAYFDDDDGSASGSAYIYRRSGDVWNEVDKLTASDGAADDFFGVSVAISEEYAIVGAYFDDDDGSASGSAYIYRRSGDVWNEVDKLTASDAAAVDQFGLSVAISGDYAIVGASTDDDDGNDSGSAYIYRRSGDVWSEVDKLTASDGAADDQFGNAVAIGREYAIVGAYFNDDAGTSSGSAYVFLK